MEERIWPDKVTIDSHVHYVAASGKCRPAVVIDAGDGETIAFLFAFVTPDEGHTIWHPNCQHDEEMKMSGTWHMPEYDTVIPEYEG